jgi:hypothetical protein
MKLFGKKTDPKFKFDVGDKVKDTITGFSGIVVYRTQWLNNCNTYGVAPQELKDGIPVKNQHFDEPQLLMVDKESIKKSQGTGGPDRKIQRTNR